MTKGNKNKRLSQCIPPFLVKIRDFPLPSMLVQWRVTFNRFDVSLHQEKERHGTRGWSFCWDEFVETEPLDELIPSNWNTLAETNVRPWKLMVGRWSFPFGFRPISSGVLVCFREGRFHFTLLDTVRGNPVCVIQKGRFHPSTNWHNGCVWSLWGHYCITSFLNHR